MMNREMAVLRDFETFLSKSGTIPDNQTKFYILGERLEADSHGSKGTSFMGADPSGGEECYSSGWFVKIRQKIARIEWFIYEQGRRDDSSGFKSTKILSLLRTRKKKF
jgi:hypothetical protein